MKWALTSPDGLGDFLLRLPWLFAMEQAGWELTLLARQPTIELAMLTGLQGRMVPLGNSPYSKETRRLRDPFQRERIIAEKSGLVFLGPSQPSFFEEEIGGKLRGPQLAGFVLDEPFWPSESVTPAAEIARSFDLRIGVSNMDTEPDRNRKAAEVLLQRPVECPPFRFPIQPPVDPTLLPTGDYVVVSPGYRQGDYFSGMGRQRWVTELRGLEKSISANFVFTGSALETEENQAIHQGLSVPERHRNLTGQLPNLASLLSLLSSSIGYVGKDSGTVHLAASLGKPIVAVYGGGHWKRFLPTGTRAVVLTTVVPCRGCDWRCHLPEPVCATGIREGAIVEGWQRVFSLSEERTEIMENAPGVEAEALIKSTPQDDYPEKQHAIRRARLAEERALVLSPWPSRFWRGLKR
jgi:hypothetical protein